MDWEHPVVIQKDDKALVEEFSTNLIKILSPEKIESNYKLTIIYKVLKTTIGIKSGYTIVQFQSTENISSLIQPMNLKGLEGFNGSIAYYNLNGDLEKIDGYKRGLLTSTLPKSAMLSPGTVEYNVPEDDNGYVRIQDMGYADNYSMTNSTIYIYSRHTSTNSVWVYQDRGGNASSGSVVHSHHNNGGGGGGQGPSNNNVNHPREDIIKIDPSLKAFPFVEKVVSTAYAKFTP
ncbi:hypothetical protein [Flavimarina sp. Hel_I_48]|uniref:hypothetical protein n=1 Tax=Flavimarina sp. Hel_I_48 TaxID=1392488 RepID=UPI0004DF4EC6|nr:hypothetical protein [Flavimarina sp. Hel_I_48]